ncbi:MAG TPA: hypothetical protein VLC09_00635 [Polyangiaceae bacterium]|nr:hypothetical protein [Polyangiaceae bacterium]
MSPRTTAEATRTESARRSSCSPRRFGAVVALFVLGVPAVGCDNAAAQKCHAEMSTAQAALLAMNAGDRANVQQVLGGIESALASCQAAGRSTEVKELTEAKANLSGHLVALDKRASQGSPHALTPEQLAKLIKEGDPACPRGHAYEHGDSKKTIRCTGPQLYEMSLAQAQDHYTRRGFSLAIDPTRKRLKAEYGAEVVVFDFAESDSKKPAACLTLVAPPGIPWQEVVTRATGVPPARLTEGKPVQLDGRQLAVRLEGKGPDKTVLLGDCPAPQAPAAAPPATAPAAPAAAP